MKSAKFMFHMNVNQNLRNVSGTFAMIRPLPPPHPRALKTQLVLSRSHD